MHKKIILLIFMFSLILISSAQTESYPAVPPETAVLNQVNNNLPPVPTQTEPGLPEKEQIEIERRLPEKPKTVIMEFNIKEGIVTQVGTRIVYDAASGHSIGFNQFNVRVASRDDRTIEEFGIMDPRIRIVEDGGIIFTDDVNFSVPVPFYESMKEVSLVNATTGREMIKVDVKKDIDDFCERNPEDQQCRAINVNSSSGVEPSSSTGKLPAIGGFITAAILLFVTFVIKRAKN